MGVVTYRLVLDLLGLTTLERNAVTLVLQTLGGDQSLDLGGLGVRRLALTLGLDLTSDDVLADLYSRNTQYISLPRIPQHIGFIYISLFFSQTLLGGIHCKGFFSLIPQKQRPSR